jgi:hypothetical protein
MVTSRCGCALAVGGRHHGPGAAPCGSRFTAQSLRPPGGVGQLGASHNPGLCEAARVPGLLARGRAIRRYAPARVLPEPT